MRILKGRDNQMIGDFSGSECGVSAGIAKPIR
jgi:hypothetical protein